MSNGQTNISMKDVAHFTIVSACLVGAIYGIHIGIPSTATVYSATNIMNFGNKSAIIIDTTGYLIGWNMCANALISLCDTGEYLWDMTPKMAEGLALDVGLLGHQENTDTQVHHW